MGITRTQTYTVTGTGGAYATEIMYLSRDGTVPTVGDLGPDAVTIVIGTVVADVDVELDVLDADGNWVNMAVIEAVGVNRYVLDGLPARIRAQSGGTSGSQVVTARIT